MYSVEGPHKYSMCVCLLGGRRGEARQKEGKGKGKRVCDRESKRDRDREVDVNNCVGLVAPIHTADLIPL